MVRPIELKEREARFIRDTEMDDKILESDFFERSTPPSCCELLAILFADVTDGREEVTELRGPRSGSAPDRSTTTGQSVTDETK